MKSIVSLFLIAFFFVQTVFTQGLNDTQSTLSLSTTPILPTTPTTPSTQIPQIPSQPTSTVTEPKKEESEQTEETEIQAAPKCKPGISIGYMIIRQPNISTIAYTGSKFNVSWDYSVTVTNPPQFVDAYLQLISPGIQVTWKKKIAEKIPANSRQFFWEPKSLVEGKYKLRLVPDGKETYNVKANELPCFGNGEAIPSVSSAFQIVSPKSGIAEYPEKFPPSSSTKTANWSLFIYMWCVTALFIL